MLSLANVSQMKGLPCQIFGSSWQPLDFERECKFTESTNFFKHSILKMLRSKTYWTLKHFKESNYKSLSIDFMASRIIQ